MPSPELIFDHVGIPTDEKQPAEDWVESTRVWVTNPRTHKYRVEYLRYEPDTPCRAELVNLPHVAYQVHAEDLDALLESAEILIEPGERVPLCNGSANVILSTQVIHLIPEFDDYLKECRRLLASDGYLIITTHGTWTHHPASGGDYYRFTHDGLRHILKRSGFEIEEIRPIVGTLGTGLHLRQLVFNAWLKRCGLGAFAKLLNVFTNVRIVFEEKITPYGTRMSSPVIYAAVAKVVGAKHE